MLIGRLATEEQQDEDQFEAMLEWVQASEGYVGSASCAGCHANTHQNFMDTLHPQMLGPVEDIADEVIERWPDLPDERGNPVVFDENAPTGLASARDLNLADGTQLQDVAGVYVRHQGSRQFIAEFRDQAGEALHRIDVSPYHIGQRYRQALAVNLGDGEGTRLLKYQYSFDDGAYQHTWRDRNQARIYEENCIGCHTSGFNLEAWRADKNQPLESVSADLGVGCESCHGPGKKHIDNPMQPGLIVAIDKLTAQQAVHNCAQCHIRGTSKIHPGRQDNLDFRPGDNVLDHLKPVPVAWGHGTNRVAADGKAAASRQQFMDHNIGSKADMSCAACHSMHKPDSTGALLRQDLVSFCAACHGDSYPDKDAVLKSMDGKRDWSDARWQGWQTQHTFQLDEEGRVIGLPEEDWPESDVWPWEND